MRNDISIIPKESTEKMNTGLDTSLSCVLDYLKSSADEEFSRNKARVGLGLIGAYVKLRQTDRVKDATQLTVAQLVANNPKELKKYIKASMPHLVPTIK